MRDIDDVVKRAVEKKRDQFAQEQIDAARGPMDTPQLVSEYCESRFCVRSRGHTGNCKDSTGLEVGTTVGTTPHQIEAACTAIEAKMAESDVIASCADVAVGSSEVEVPQVGTRQFTGLAGADHEIFHAFGETCREMEEHQAAGARLNAKYREQLQQVSALAARVARGS